jgi:structural maintenance of chromosomes protein 5
MERLTQENAHTGLSNCRKRVLDIRAEEDRLILERVQLALQHQEHLPRIRDARQALLEAQIRLIEAEADIKGLQARNEEVTTRLDQEKTIIQDLKTELEELRRAAMQAQDKVSDMIDGDHHKLHELTGKMGEKTLEDIDHDISAAENTLNLIHPVPAHVLQQFQRRARDIEELTRKKEEMTRKLENLTTQIAQLMQRWEPRVDDLISRINEAFAHNFEQISCAGEVGVHKDEDFEQWAIEIKVKFR